MANFAMRLFVLTDIQMHRYQRQPVDVLSMGGVTSPKDSAMRGTFFAFGGYLTSGQG